MDCLVGVIVVGSGVVVSVVNVTAVVVLSVTMIGDVVVTVVELLACLFLRYSFTIASCLARSTNLDASSGSSLWTASIASWPCSKTPSRYFGLRWPSTAALNESPGNSFKTSSHSATVEASNSLSSSTDGSGRARANNGRPRRRMDRRDGMLLL